MEGKGKLEFELPFQEVDFKAATHGMDLALLLIEIRSEIHMKVKFEENDEERRKWEEFEEFINDRLESNLLLDLINSVN